jgi:hypothetical protein
MTRVTASCALAVTVALSALVSACGPSIDAAAKADLDQRVAALGNRGQNFPAPASAAPMPFAVGHWVTYKFVDDKGQPSLMTMKLVGQEGPDFWYEMVNESYYGKTGIRMLVDFGDRQRPESITIKAAKLRDAKGQIIEYPPAMIGMMNSTLRGQLGPIVINWNGLPQEDVSVIAGKFTGAYKGRSEVTFAGFKSSSVVWGHSAVPLSGMVRSQGDNNSTGELVDFGTSGARSDF